MFHTSCELEIVSILICRTGRTISIQVHDLYKTRKSTKNWSSNFGLIKEIKDLSYIILAVQ